MTLITQVIFHLIVLLVISEGFTPFIVLVRFIIRIFNVLRLWYYNIFPWLRNEVIKVFKVVLIQVLIIIIVHLIQILVIVLVLVNIQPVFVFNILVNKLII